MMEGATSISALLSPPLSLSPSSNLNFVHLDENQFIDGATYCIYDPTHPTSAYQIVLQGDAAESDALTFEVGGEETASIFRLEVDPTTGVLQLANNNQDSTQTQLKTDNEQIPIPVASEYIIAEEANENIPHPTHQQPQQQQPDALAATLPAFYNDMAIALSNDSETHDTYLPLSFDEASHFLFHGREECVITTDIPIPTAPATEPFCLLAPPWSSSSNNSLDSNTSNASANVVRRTSKKKKAPWSRTPPSPLRVEGSMVTRKVFKCPHEDCKFWAARGHRFHEHMSTHDSVRPYGCSECTYETNWKSDVKKHIARMIERNSKEHEKAVLTRLSEKKVDTECYKDYLVDLDVPCNMFSGRVGEPGRCSRKSKKRSQAQEQDTNGASCAHSDLSSSSSSNVTSTSTSSAFDTPPAKKPRSSKPKKKKTTIQPMIMITQIVETEQVASIPVPPPPEIYLPPLESKPVIETEVTTSTAPSGEAIETFPVAEAEEVIGTASEDIEAVEEVEVKDPADPGLQSTIATEEETMVEVFSSADELPQPICKDSKQKPSTTSAKKSSQKTTSKKSATGNTKSNPAVAVPANAPKKSVLIDSGPMPDVIVRKPGENGGFQQYFLVVDNGSKDGVSASTPTRKERQAEKGNVQCDMCPFVGQDGHVLAQHKGFHGSLNENLTYSCLYCNFKSATRKDMEQHKHLHTQSNGKQLKLQDYSRANIKRSENGHGDTSTLISKH